MGQLADVADRYEREARRKVSGKTARQLRDTADLFRYMVANRETVDPTVLRLHPCLRIDQPGKWCRQHGYRANVGEGGLTIQRGDEPARVASWYDTLHWDGQQITVEPSA